MTLKERFWAKVEKTHNCWNWTAAITPDSGYGAFNIGERIERAHRFSVILSGREIPPGMFVDHICRNRRCVRPEHLRVVTPRQNAIENSVSIFAVNARKTECPRGHAYNDTNTYRRKDGRGKFCRVCAKERKRHEAKIRAGALQIDSKPCQRCTRVFEFVKNRIERKYCSRRCGDKVRIARFHQARQLAKFSVPDLEALRGRLRAEVEGTSVSVSAAPEGCPDAS